MNNTANQLLSKLRNLFSNKKAVLWTVIAIVAIIILTILINRSNGSASNETATSTATTTEDVVTTTTTTSGGVVYAPAKTTTTARTLGEQEKFEVAVSNTQSLAALIGNARIMVPTTGLEVVLTDGKASYTDTQGKAGTVALGTIFSKTKVDDGSYDVFVQLTLNNSAVSNEQRLAVFKVSTREVTLSSSAVIGLNVKLDRIVIRNYPDSNPLYVFEKTGTRYAHLPYQVIVYYFGHANAENPATTPTVPMDATFRVLNHVVSQ